MAKFNFKRLIKKYRTKQELKTTSEGHYDYSQGGVWVEGETVWIDLNGAVLPLGKELEYENSGFTTDDKKLYTYIDVAENQTVRHRQREYTTMELTDYGEFDDGMRVVILKSGGVDD